MTPRSFNVFRVSLLIRNFDSFPSFLASIPPSGLAMISPLSHDGSGLDFLARLVGRASSDEIAYAQREIKKHIRSSNGSLSSDVTSCLHWIDH